MTTIHIVSLAYMAYFFRYRRLTLPATLFISIFYNFYFGLTNKITYNIVVDRKITSIARSLGYARIAQPNGVLHNRNIE